MLNSTYARAHYRMPCFEEYLHMVFSRSLVENYIPPTFSIDEAEDAAGASAPRDFPSLIERLANLQAYTWLVHGSAGSGKTSLINQLAAQILKKEILCLRVNSRFFETANECHDVLDFVKDNKPEFIERPIWKSAAKHRRIIILIDGLNEVQRRHGGKWPDTLVQRLIDGGHGFPVLATSRHVPEWFGESGLRGTVRLGLTSFSSEQVESYLSTHGLDANHALGEIKAAGLESAASNPFLLSLIVRLIGVPPLRSGLPRTRAGVLLMSLDTAQQKLTGVERRLAEKGLTLKAALSAASFCAFLSPNGTFRQDDIRQVCRSAWPELDIDIDPIIDALLDTYLIDMHEGANGRTFEFLHNSIVDFGIALGWNSEPPPPFVFLEGILEQSVGDWVGLQDDPDAAVLALLDYVKAAKRFDLLVDIAVANRGALGEETLQRLWTTIGFGLSSGRKAREITADAVSLLSPSMIRDALRHGILRACPRRS